MLSSLKFFKLKKYFSLLLASFMFFSSIHLDSLLVVAYSSNNNNIVYSLDNTVIEENYLTKPAVDRINESDIYDTLEYKIEDYYDSVEEIDELELVDHIFEDYVSNVDSLDDIYNKAEITSDLERTNFSHEIKYTMSCESFMSTNGYLSAVASNAIVLVDCPVSFDQLTLAGSNIRIYVVDEGSLYTENFSIVGQDNTITVKNGGLISTETVTLLAGCLTINVDGGSFLRRSANTFVSDGVIFNFSSGTIELLVRPNFSIIGFNLNMSGGEFIMPENADFINSNLEISGGTFTMGHSSTDVQLENTQLSVTGKGTLNASTSEIKIASDSTLNIANHATANFRRIMNEGGELNITGGTTSVEDMLLSNAKINMNDGQLITSAMSLIANAQKIIEAGHIEITDSPLVMLNSSIKMSGGSISTPGLSVNAGKIEISNGTFMLVSTDIENEPFINNHSQLNVLGDGTFVSDSNSLVIAAGSTLNISDNAVVNLQSGLSLGIYGNLNIAGGIATVAGQVLITEYSTVIMTDGTFESNMITIIGSVTNMILSGGTYKGTIMVNGELELSGTASIEKGAMGGVLVDANGIFKMSGGRISNNSSFNFGGGVTLLSPTAKFIMKSGEITGNRTTSATGGGGVRVNDGTFTMTGGMISNNEAPMGGGVSFDGSESLELKDATINANIGGGIYVNGADLILDNMLIIGNETNGAGGGIYIIDGDLVIQNNTIISHNLSHGSGGGIASLEGIVEIDNSTISNNRVAHNGGGIYLASNIKAHITDSTIRNNEAAAVGIANLPAECRENGGLHDVITCAGDGGAIFTDNFRNLTTDNVEFSNNQAIRPININFDTENALIQAMREIHDTNILNTIQSSGFLNTYNNFDIWDVSIISDITDPENPTGFHVVTYHGNGSTWGTPPIPATVPYGESWIVSGSNTLERLHYEFIGWNTAPDGSGINFEPRELIKKLDGNLALHAQWEAVRHKVEFNLQGGDDDEAFSNQIILHGELAIKPAIHPERIGYEFVNWYTEPKTLGFSFARLPIINWFSGATGGIVFDFATPITANTTIYARWSAILPLEEGNLETLETSTLPQLGTIQMNMLVIGLSLLLGVGIFSYLKEKIFGNDLNR